MTFEQDHFTLTPRRDMLGAPSDWGLLHDDKPGALKVLDKTFPLRGIKDSPP
jgi:hypothetical protein